MHCPCKARGEDNPGAIIVSGGAKGIDGYAHTAAIKNGLRTIVFFCAGRNSGTETTRQYFEKHHR
jgi:predicted Rossmann fold nucleotide-binding protein DprA/Smf involved in DNA uptake